MSYPEHPCFINQGCVLEQQLPPVRQGMHMYVLEGGCLCMDTCIRMPQHPQECPSGALVGGVQPQGAVPCGEQGCVMPAAPGTGDGCLAR